MKATVKELDDKDKLIIKLIMRRVSYKKMTRVVFMSTPGINRRLKAMRDYYNCKTTQDLIAYLQDNALI